MKQLILIASVAILMASCSGSAFLKRKYTKGVYRESVAKTDKPESHTLVNANTQKEQTPSTKQVSNSDVNAININTEKDYTEFASNVSLKKALNQAKFRNSQNQSIVSYKAKSIDAVIAKNKQAVKQNNKGGGGNGDGNFVLMVILCFFPFLCLIPVYRHDGRKATLNFWLTLLLHLTFIGYIVYSLLVIFNVIDLS